MKKINFSAFHLFGLLLGLMFFISSCTKEELIEKSGDKEITSFALKDVDGNELETIVNIKIDSVKKVDTIKIEVPFYTNLTNLTPIISLKGMSVSPASGEVQNFENQIAYTVTAEDGSVSKYIVEAKLGPLKNVLYWGDGNKTFYALNANTGKVIWKYDGTKGFSYADPIVDNGIVYTGSIDGHLYALDAVTGALKWKYFTSSVGIESSPAVADGIVYFGSNDRNFYALNAKDGTLLWKYTTQQNVSSSPTVVNGMVYFGNSALNAKTGDLVWKFQTRGMINQSSPVVHDGVVFIGSSGGYLYALNAANGQLKWEYEAGVSLEQSSPMLGNGLVYVGGWYNWTDKSAGAVYAINVLNGNLVWKSLDNTGFSADPFVTDNLVYISGDDMYFHALNAKDGSKVWNSRILPNGAGATVANGLVFVGGGGTGFFYAFNAETGAIKWKTPIQALSNSSPCVIDANGKMIHR